jgi:hypothetical protein
MHEMEREKKIKWSQIYNKKGSSSSYDATRILRLCIKYNLITVARNEDDCRHGILFFIFYKVKSGDGE